MSDGGRAEDCRDGNNSIFAPHDHRYVSFAWK